MNCISLGQICKSGRQIWTHHACITSCENRAQPSHRATRGDLRSSMSHLWKSHRTHGRSPISIMPRCITQDPQKQSRASQVAAAAARVVFAPRGDLRAKLGRLVQLQTCTRDVESHVARVNEALGVFSGSCLDEASSERPEPRKASACIGRQRSKRRGRSRCPQEERRRCQRSEELAAEAKTAPCRLTWRSVGPFVRVFCLEVLVGRIVPHSLCLCFHEAPKHSFHSSNL
mmetsp:Transcript_11667/g.18601  ORF Transcript_11667/g.18601 Transcript_11667/m.18601 type:complete len:230 (+) Transcript_11667:105-794(+)